MPVPSRRFLVVALLAVVVAGLTCYRAGTNSRPGEGLGELSDLRRELDESRQTDAELERQRHIYLQRIAARDQVVAELLTVRLTLGQAAVRWRAIETELPVMWGRPPRTTDGPRESERLCREVMFWAKQWVAARLPAEAARVAARLEAELEQLRGPDGVVCLPD